MSKQVIALKPCTWVYLIMMVITFFTWTVSKFGLSGLTVSLLVLGLSLIKGHLIGHYFMGLKWVASGWRWLVSGWLLIPGALISLAFYIGT